MFLSQKIRNLDVLRRITSKGNSRLGIFREFGGLLTKLWALFSPSVKRNTRNIIEVFLEEKERSVFESELDIERRDEKHQLD
ncbi:hypothetical protein VULLAG_LOCUS22224 [Vulpes lagopus]